MTDLGITVGSWIYGRLDHRGGFVPCYPRFMTLRRALAALLPPGPSDRVMTAIKDGVITVGTRHTQETA